MYNWLGYRYNLSLSVVWSILTKLFFMLQLLCWNLLSSWTLEWASMILDNKPWIFVKKPLLASVFQMAYELSEQKSEQFSYAFHKFFLLVSLCLWRDLCIMLLFWKSRALLCLILFICYLLTDVLFLFPLQIWISDKTIICKIEV